MTEARAPQVKICGVTRREDAVHAAHAGADYLGVVLSPGFSRSARVVDAREFWRGLTPKKVAVLVDASPSEASTIAEGSGADIVQLHGAESPDDVAALRLLGQWQIWKAVRPQSVDELRRAVDRFGRHVDGILVEGYRRGVVGGGGVRVSLAAEDVRAAIPSEVELILAGGLDPGNVASVVSTFAPTIVDTSSGIELALGEKDPKLVSAFIASARDPL